MEEGLHNSISEKLGLQLQHFKGRQVLHIWRATVVKALFMSWACLNGGRGKCTVCNALYTASGKRSLVEQKQASLDPLPPHFMNEYNEGCATFLQMNTPSQHLPSPSPSRMKVPRHFNVAINISRHNPASHVHYNTFDLIRDRRGQ